MKSKRIIAYFGLKTNLTCTPTSRRGGSGRPKWSTHIHTRPPQIIRLHAGTLFPMPPKPPMPPTPRGHKAIEATKATKATHATRIPDLHSILEDYSIFWGQNEFNPHAKRRGGGSGRPKWSTHIHTRPPPEHQITCRNLVSKATKATNATDAPRTQGH